MRTFEDICEELAIERGFVAEPATKSVTAKSAYFVMLMTEHYNSGAHISATSRSQYSAAFHKEAADRFGVAAYQDGYRNGYRDGLPS